MHKIEKTIPEVSMAESAYVFDATEQDFETRVLHKSRETPVVVDFWAPWCGPCRALAPVLERLVNQRGGSVLLAKVNTDDEQQLAVTFRIDVLPTVIAFRDGKPVNEFVGVLPEAELNAFLDRLAPSESEKQTSSAAKLEQSNPDEAEKLYRAALAADPNQDAANVGLARVLIAKGKEAEASELLERVGVHGDLGVEAAKLNAIVWLRQQAASAADEASLRRRVEADSKDAQGRYHLGLRLAVAEQYQPALDMLLAAGELDRKLAANEVREAMVKIFHIVGVRSELADTCRDKLSGLLY
jgi:putative thioredoxin